MVPMNLNLKSVVHALGTWSFCAVHVHSIL